TYPAFMAGAYRVLVDEGILLAKIADYVQQRLRLPGLSATPPSLSKERNTTMRKLLAIAALLACTTAADARAYNYACNVPDEATGNTRLHPLKIETVKRTITWRGSTFKNLKEGNITRGGEDCAKYCFLAIRSNGDVAFVSTATQGVASLSITRSGKAPIGFEGDMILDD